MVGHMGHHVPPSLLGWLCQPASQPARSQALHGPHPPRRAARPPPPPHGRWPAGGSRPRPAPPAAALHARRPGRAARRRLLHSWPLPPWCRCHRAGSPTHRTSHIAAQHSTPGRGQAGGSRMRTRQGGVQGREKRAGPKARVGGWVHGGGRERAGTYQCYVQQGGRGWLAVCVPLPTFGLMPSAPQMRAASSATLSTPCSTVQCSSRAGQGRPAAGRGRVGWSALTSSRLDMAGMTKRGGLWHAPGPASLHLTNLSMTCHNTYTVIYLYDVHLCTYT